MSITHSESGRPPSTQSSNGIEEVTDKSRDEMGDLSVVRAPANLILVASPVKIGSKNWEAAEAVACEIIQNVRPTSVSEEKRREVIGYIQKLIKNYLGVEVHTYGSVPLKTYLPDGDIDLTAFGGPNVEDSLIEDMKFILEEEEKNTSASAEFVIKDVQLIRAEVKLVKCIVQNIVVDISVNQLGGLCTLCFLEKIDHLIGKDHLFKRSIILIKAWCYYESRILGAHHGLISTYALETLVLYIFHLYHSELDGPLAVLYKFLDYFSKFDWDTYCISLIGPIRLSSLPEIVVEMPGDSVEELLLSTDFLSSCVEMFSVPPRGGDQNSRGFPRKHLNIVDPMKEFNNLGRSVSKGNFYRVCSAFTYGARKLARILSQPENAIVNELHKFFSNTMARHSDRQGPGVHDFDSPLTRNGSYSTVPVLRTGSCKMDNSTHHDRYEDTFATRDSQNGHANDIMTYGFPGLKISTDPSKTQNQNLKENIKLFYAPHLFFANSKIQNGITKDEKLDSDNCDLGSTSKSEKTKSLNLLTDLTGDYESHFQRLRYGRWCYENMLGMHSMHIPSSPTAPYQNGPWEGAVPLFKRNEFSRLHHNGFHPGPTVYSMKHVLIPGVPFGWEEISKPRGTGTYFPNMNQSPHGYMPSVITGRNWASSRSPYNNGTMIYPDPNLLDISNHEPPQYHVHGDKHAMVAVSESYQPFSPLANGFPKPNGFVFQPEGVADFVSVGHTTGTSVAEKVKEQKPVSSSPKSVPGTQKEEPAFSKEEDRFSYRLKDEDDFPPLSE